MVYRSWFVRVGEGKVNRINSIGGVGLRLGFGIFFSRDEVIVGVRVNIFLDVVICFGCRRLRLIGLEVRVLCDR